MGLLSKLTANDKKKGLFNSTDATIFYPTGLTPLDYRNGTMMKVYDENDELINEYPMIGIQDGSINMMAGEPGTFKTTSICTMAYNIVKPFEDGLVIHLDVEQSFSMNRIKDVTGMPRKDIGQKYILTQEKVFIEQIMERIKQIHDEKVDNRKEYEYDTGLVDEVNRNIIKLVPTVMIIDSLKVLNSDSDKATEMEGQTAAGRKAMALTQFMEKVTPMCKEANIILLIINHAKEKIEMMFSRTKSQFAFMKQGNKQLAGGVAARYLATNVWYLDVCGKFTVEENGFSGAKSKVWLWKTRSNFAGSSCELVYNQEKGYDDKMSLYNLLLVNEQIGGRNPGRYILGYEDIKFDDRKLYIELQTRPEIYEVIKKAAHPFLMEMISSKNESDDAMKAIVGEE